MPDVSDRMQIPEYVRRELSEVYLLMDHIAGRQDKTLDTALAASSTNGAGISLDQLCAVPWPVPPEDRAKTLATVLTAKDRLSRAAHPATSWSIAFTYVSVSPANLAASPFRLRRLMADLRRFVLRPAPVDETNPPGDAKPASEAPVGPAAPKPAHGGEPAAMLQFVRYAFPGLERKRRRLAATIRWLMVLLLVLLGLTCVVTWDLAVGQRLLSDFKWLAQHPEVMVSAQATDVPTAPVIKPGSHEARVLAQKRILPALQPWNCSQRLLSWFVHACPAPPPAGAETQIDDAQDMEIGRLLVTTLNYNVLPLLLGALAATAAAVRMIARKVHGNELAPADLMLVWPRVALGAFLGAVIGLLVGPSVSNGLFAAAAGGATAAAAASDGSDAVALSPAAYSFLAGFATNRIFEWLDNVIDRIFHFSNPKA